MRGVIRVRRQVAALMAILAAVAVAVVVSRPRPAPPVASPSSPPWPAVVAVARVYGESEPTLDEFRPTTTEVDGRPMFIVFLSGHFRRGDLKATHLEFSMLADGSYAWGIRGYDDAGDVWLDDDLPSSR